MTLKYLDPERLDEVDPEAFRARRPFPWQAFEALLRPEAYQRLVDHLPPRERFKAVFGRRRAHGQRSHDRYVLQHRRGMPLPGPWREFIAELRRPGYRQWVARLLGRDDFILHFHWHYAPDGCSVSPHCDAPWKFGSHIFYLNTESDWDPRWGGETVVLDDGGRFAADSAPEFDDFEAEYGGPALGNNSLAFARQEHSWHGVRPVHCPAGALRKVFIVEFRRDSPWMRLRTLIGV